jgi:peptidoglycan/xylan/chitin deacetylase (PgdA/CDA1 family)
MKYLNDEIPQAIFNAHVDYLQDRYTLLSLKDAVSLLVAGELPKGKPGCTISFDDGLQSVYTHAFPVLSERGIPFDVFINTSSINNNDLLLLHALNYLLTTYTPDKVSEVINEMLDADMPHVQPDAVSIECWFRDNCEYCFESDIIGRLYKYYNLSIKEIAAEQNLYLNWDQIKEMSDHDVGFYSHTHRHFPLNAFSNEDLVKIEINKAYDIMNSHHIDNDFVSFPFGMEKDYGKNNIQHALSAGHEFVVEVGDGINSSDRIVNKKILSRVGLGNIGSDCASLYSAIEIRPSVKTRLKSLLIGTS